MELKDLVGLHALSGVDLLTGGTDTEQCSFVLDGVTYICRENPDDGYRSYMDDIECSAESVKNMFLPQSVLCSVADDILEMRDAVTGKEVLRVGTDHSENYYPYCVLEFSPQNMACNANSGETKHG